MFFILIMAINAQSQLIVKPSGNVKIGSQLTAPSGGKLEITGNNETLEARIFTTSEDMACLWTINSIYAFGFGIDQYGNGNIFRNINSKSAIMTFRPNGYFGIGRIPSYKLDIDGNMRANALIYNSNEDIRTNVEPLSDRSDDLFKLQSISFDLSTSKTKITDTMYQKQTSNDSEFAYEPEQDNRRLHYGFMEKEVQQFFPELVYKDNNGTLSIDYISLIPILVDVVKRQNKTIEDLRKDIERLKYQERGTADMTDSREGIVLSQNQPNPFNISTSISLTLPNKINKAELVIYDMKGSLIKSYPIHKRNKVEISINANDLEPGLYFYSLFIDSQLVDTRPMICTK